MLAKQEQEVARFRELLKNLVKLTGLSNREIERRLGLSPGYLSKLFSGVFELRLAHLLAIAEAVGLEPAELFYLAYPQPPLFSTPEAKKLHDVFGRLGQTPRQAAPPPAEPEKPSTAEVDALLLATLRRLLIDIDQQRHKRS